MILSWSTDIDVSETERQLIGIRRRLSDLDGALAGQQDLLRSNPESFSFQLSAKSLISLQGKLKAELVSLLRERRNEVIKISLDGGKYSRHSASLTDLGHFLVRFQSLYSSVAQAIKSGPTLRGRIPNTLLNATDLKLADVFPSSFGMEVYVPSEYDMHGNSITNDALEVLFQLLGSLENEEKIMRISGELGKRSFGHLRRMAQDLTRAGSDINISWSDYTGTINTWAAKVQDTEQALSYLDNIIESRSTEVEYEGLLVGASLLKNRFELLLPDQVLIEGKVVSGISKQIQDNFGSRCRVRVAETELIDRGNQDRKVFYTLTEILGEPINSPGTMN